MSLLRALPEQAGTEIADDFNAPTSEAIGTPWAALAADSLASNLALRAGSLLDNRFAPPTNPPVATSGTLGGSYHTTPLSSDDMEVGAELVDMATGATQGNHNTVLVARAAPGTGTYVGASFFTGSQPPGLLKHASRNDTTIGSAPTARPTPVRAHTKLRVVGNVLRNYINGVQVMTATDSTHLRGAGYRHAGLRGVSLRSTAGGAVSLGPGFDNFWARDINANRKAESQAVYLSAALSVASGATWVTVGNSAAIPTAANGVQGKFPYVKATRFEGQALAVTGEGTVDISARVTMTASAAGLQVQVMKNGVALATSTAVTGTVATITAPGVSVVDGDTIAFQVRHTAGAARSVAAGVFATFLEMLNPEMPVVPATYGDNFGEYSGPQMAVRMNKSGTTPTFGANNTWVDLTGWSALNDNHYSSSIVDGDLSLIAPADWDNAKITASIPWRNASGAGSAQIRIVRISDGAVIATSAAVGSVSASGAFASMGNSNKCFVAATGVAVAAGDRFKVQGKWSAASTGPYAGTTTGWPYLSIEQQVVETLNPSLWDTWSTGAGGGTINIVNGQANGEGVTPSTPLSYATFRRPMESGDHVVRLTLAGLSDHWHSSVSCMVRISDARTSWVEFAVTKTVVAIYAWYGGQYNQIATAAAQGVLDAVNWGAAMELRAVGTGYQALINGAVVIPTTTIAAGSVPVTSRNVGFMMQDDSREVGLSGTPDPGSPTPRIAQWVATGI